MNWEILEETMFVMPNWKWLGIAAAFVIGLVLRFLFAKVLTLIKQSERVQRRLHPLIRYFFKENESAPEAWIFVCLFWASAIQALKLPEKGEKALSLLAGIWLSFNIIRWLYLGCNALGQWLMDLAMKTAATADDQLVPFITKSLKILVIVVGVLVSIQNFGINVVSILAGLGLGGLALALAAQDTAANLFGSITILMDRPFNVGDFIKVTDTSGTVLDVGFRSTRIRTTENSVVTIPNSTMAKEKIENLTARNARRLRHVVGVTYDTPLEKLKSIIDQIKYYLHQNEQIRSEDFVVSFVSLGDFSLGIEVIAHALTNDPKIAAEIQQDLLLHIMKIAADQNVEFAFPTQTLFVEKLPLPSTQSAGEVTA